MSADPDDLVRRAQETPPVDPGPPPAVYRSPSGRIVLAIHPWFDDDHELMMRELDGIIEALKQVRLEEGDGS